MRILAARMKFAALRLVCIAALVSAAAAAQTTVSKQVHLVVDGTRLIASNIKLSRFDEIQLAPRERIRDSQEGGGVILVATNQRMIAYGATTGWRAINRAANEELVSLTAEDFAGLVVTSQRLLNFNAETGIWAEYDRSAAR
jgi:hypothetical protein